MTSKYDHNISFLLKLRDYDVRNICLDFTAYCIKHNDYSIKNKKSLAMLMFFSWIDIKMKNRRK